MIAIDTATATRDELVAALTSVRAFHRSGVDFLTLPALREYARKVQVVTAHPDLEENKRKVLFSSRRFRHKIKPHEAREAITIRTIDALFSLSV